MTEVFRFRDFTRLISDQGIWQSGIPWHVQNSNDSKLISRLSCAKELSSCALGLSQSKELQLFTVRNTFLASCKSFSLSLVWLTSMFSSNPIFEGLFLIFYVDLLLSWLKWVVQWIWLLCPIRLFCYDNTSFWKGSTVCSTGFPN